MIGSVSSYKSLRLLVLLVASPKELVSLELEEDADASIDVDVDVGGLPGGLRCGSPSISWKSSSLSSKKNKPLISVSSLLYLQ